ncbi:DUF1636 domain-containing protein [Asaia sp. HN010]|uniref:DUF1636 domain-containing protein n=1 Tax=Asaia sp. HN010 TaxID=3081233 RepID=UPI0030186B1B
MTSQPIPVFHVCQTCSAGGQALHEALAAMAEPEVVRIEGVRCLAACQQGCTATLSMPGKWSWLLGRLSPPLAYDLLAYAQAYGRSASGTVMPSKRPDTLRDIILGRFPGQNGSPSASQPAVSESVS